ncbi:MAG: hypothetical protein AAF657_26700 [Acidobacteriota bacterium]
MWIYETGSGRRFAWLVLLTALAVAAIVKFGGVREPGVVEHEGLVWILGWLPSFAAGVGFPFFWPALGRPFGQLSWFGRAAEGITFLPECLTGALLLIAGEVFDGLFPKIGNTALQTFALSDIVATAAGAALAFGLHSLASPGAPKNGRPR